MNETSNRSETYKDLKQFARERGLVESRLVEAYLIEKAFHMRILCEHDRDQRRRMYHELYSKVHPYYQPAVHVVPGQKRKHEVVALFGRDIQDRSVLDVGCGDGALLADIARFLRHGRLVGIDTSASLCQPAIDQVEFIHGDIVEFDLGYRFDIIISSNVMEHIAPADMPGHLETLRRHLAADGSLIILGPNRLFGPSDITRIVDYSNTNRLPAAGSHLNESTYAEMIALLRGHGFRGFATVLPIPRVRAWLPWLRLTPAILVAMERNQWLLDSLYRVKYRGRCVARLDICLACGA